MNETTQSPRLALALLPPTAEEIISYAAGAAMEAYYETKTREAAAEAFNNALGQLEGAA